MTTIAAVTPAQALMVVVPADSHLEAEAMISNRDIGFVEVGQDAAIKVDAFNFTRYGLLQGKVLSVSPDAISHDKPLDKPTILKAIEECGFVLTVEEGCLAGGYGSAVGALRARALEHVVVDPGADLDLAAEAVAEPFERRGVVVHHDDVVLVGDEQLGEGRAHAPAADDQVSHGAHIRFGTITAVPA